MLSSPRSSGVRLITTGPQPQAESSPEPTAQDVAVSVWPTNDEQGSYTRIETSELPTYTRVETEEPTSQSLELSARDSSRVGVEMSPSPYLSETPSSVPWLSESPVAREVEHLTAMGHFTSQGHSKNVNAVSMDALGDTIASASDDGTLRIWTWNDGGCCYSLRAVVGHQESDRRMTACAIHALHKVGVCGNDQGDLFVFTFFDDFAGQAPAALVPSSRAQHEDQISGLCFLLNDEHKADEIRMASCSHDGYATIQEVCVSPSEDLDDAKSKCSFKDAVRVKHDSKVLHIRDLPTKKVFASVACCATDAIYLWTLTGELAMKLRCADGLDGQKQGFTSFGLTSYTSPAVKASRWLARQQARPGRRLSTELGCSEGARHVGLAEATYLMAASDDDLLSLWVLDDLVKRMEAARAEGRPAEAAKPLVRYKGANVRDVEVGLDNSFYVQVQHEKSFCGICFLAREEEGQGVPPPLPCTPEVVQHCLMLKHPDTMAPGFKLQHSSTITCLLIGSDPDDGAVLATGCEDGAVRFWELQGDERGERTAELRSVSYIEILGPIVGMIVSFTQVCSFAFAKVVPWREEVAEPARFVFHLASLDLTIKREVIFWPKTCTAMGVMLAFVLCAAFNVSHRILHATYEVKTWQRFKDESKKFGRLGQANILRRPAHLLVKTLVRLKDLLHIFFSLMSSALVVPLCTAMAQLVDCVAKEDGSKFVQTAPSISCYEGAHLRAVLVAVPIFASFLFFVLPFAVVLGDPDYVQAGELPSIRDWKLNSLRKATMLHLGPMHPQGENVFCTQLAEVLAKTALPATVTLMTSRPLGMMLIMTAVATAWLVTTVLYPPLMERSFWVVLVGARAFVVAAMSCAVLTLNFGRDHMGPLNLFFACGVLIPIVTICVASRQEKVADHVSVRRVLVPPRGFGLQTIDVIEACAE